MAKRYHILNLKATGLLILHQGGLNAKTEETQDKRMYETGTDNCPIKTITYFLSKSDPNAKSLFNQCVKAAISCPNPQVYENWYNYFLFELYWVAYSTISETVHICGHS
jgi:hypothetical protein